MYTLPIIFNLINIEQLIFFTDQKCMDLSNLNEDDQTFIDGNVYI